MKVYKLTMVFCVLIAMVVGSLLIFGVFTTEVAKDIAAKMIGVVLLLGAGSAVMMNVISKRGSDQNKQNKTGPNF